MNFQQWRSKIDENHGFLTASVKNDARVLFRDESGEIVLIGASGTISVGTDAIRDANTFAKIWAWSMPDFVTESITGIAIVNLSKQIESVTSHYWRTFFVDGVLQRKTSVDKSKIDALGAIVYQHIEQAQQAETQQQAFAHAYLAEVAQRVLTLATLEQPE